MGMPNRGHDKAQRDEHPERRVKEIRADALRAHFPGEHVIEREREPHPERQQQQPASSHRERRADNQPGSRKADESSHPLSSNNLFPENDVSHQYHHRNRDSAHRPDETQIHPATNR